MNPLDYIESRLQALVESSAMLIPGSASDIPLAHQLVAAMRRNMRPDPTGNLTAPGIYVIHVHSDTFNAWQNTETVLAGLAGILQETACDAGIVFDSVPSIRIEIDPQQTPGEIKIATQSAVSEAGYTQSISVQELNDNEASCGTSEEVSQAYLIISGGDLFPLEQPVINIGRRHDNHLVINDPRISRNHCQLRLVHKAYVLFDLNSTGGTFVNNLRITRQTLKTGDVISLAGVQIIYGEDSAAQTTGRLLSNDDTANLKRL